MYFDELDLNDNVLDALYDMRFDTCTPVQEKCIPEILEGHDVLGVAQTGTGKTAAYLLPVLSKLDDGGYPKWKSLGDRQFCCLCRLYDTFVCDVYILPCFDPCTTEKTLAAVRSWCDLFAYCGNLYALYVAGPPAGRLLGLVTIRRHMDRGSGRCLAEFQEDEKERPSENSLLSGNGLGSHNCF